jgi:hypothetical protein
MAGTVTDVCNQALDAIGCSDQQIGDVEEGTKQAQLLLRTYAQCRQQLLRAAHWDFARMTAPLTLLADATGNTANVGTLVIDPRFVYEYSYPTTCLKARFIPWNLQNQQSPVPPSNISAPSTPQTTGQQTIANGQRIVPARFTIATDINYPPPQGTAWWEVQGVSPNGRTVILTNVQSALLVYTTDVLYPNLWDAQFRAGLVAYIASDIALGMWAQKDRNFGLKLRDQQIKLAKEKITAARLTDGNEGVYSSDIPVDWMNIRNSGGGILGYGQSAGWNAGPGVLGYGWDGAYFSDGSSY